MITRELRERDAALGDVIEWLKEEHQQDLEEASSETTLIRLLRGPAGRHMSLVWALNDYMPADGGPPLMVRYTQRQDLDSAAHKIVRGLAEARLAVYRVTAMIPSVWIDVEPLTPSRRGGTLSDKSVRNALQPVSSCLATARREGLIEHNPCDDAVLPHRPAIEEDEDETARPFPRIEVENADGKTEMVETMELVVSLVKAEHRLMFELLAATGVRRSELIAFQVRDLVLTGGEPFVKIRRRIRRRRGHGLVVGALKSRYGRRELPIACELADRLAAHVAGRDPKDWVFATADGRPLDPDNLATRVLAPACEEAGVAWAGFHTFRHTVASRLFADGRNIVQVQHWLGHHSPSFTLDTYVHLLDGNLGAPLAPFRGRPTASSGASPLDPDLQLAAT